jgi:hypothetical protein
MVDVPFSTDTFRKSLELGLKVSLTISRGDETGEYHFIMDIPEESTVNDTLTLNKYRYIFCTLYRSNVKDILRLPKCKFIITDLLFYIDPPIYPYQLATFGGKINIPLQRSMKVYPRTWHPCFDNLNLIGISELVEKQITLL